MSEPSPSNPSDTDPPGSPAPTASGRRREGNDSLWKRARRTLGTSSLTFLQPQSRPTRSTTKDGGPAAPNKRREQVRHAQRTHRQRTQNYIKTLESEVIRLRGQENSLTTERDKLQGQVDVLRTACILNNIVLPLGLEDSGPAAENPSAPGEKEMPVTITYENDEFSNPRLQVDWPSVQSSVEQFSNPLPRGEAYGLGQTVPTLPNDFVLPTSNQPTVDTARPRQQSRSSARQTPNQSQRRTPPSAPIPSADVSPTPLKHCPTGKITASRTVLLDDPATAIDFVLALEQPCLPHIHHPGASPLAHEYDGAPSTTDLGVLPDVDFTPSNHVQMLSAPLVQYAPQAPKVDSSWQASATVIKELLNLSKCINLEGEITPVEAWWRLRDHPGFSSIGRQEMEELKKLLGNEVQCCGFGAVLSKQAFLEAVAKVLEPSAKALERQQLLNYQQQQQQQYGRRQQQNQGYKYGISYS